MVLTGAQRNRRAPLTSVASSNLAVAAIVRAALIPKPGWLPQPHPPRTTCFQPVPARPLPLPFPHLGPHRPLLRPPSAPAGPGAPPAAPPAWNALPLGPTPAQLIPSHTPNLSSKPDPLEPAVPSAATVAGTAQLRWTVGPWAPARSGAGLVDLVPAVIHTWHGVWLLAGAP